MKTEFKATTENLLALVEAANNANGTGDFVEAGDPMPLSDHPLRNEILEKIESGEIVFS
jgi:hypothetical protein